MSLKRKAIHRFRVGSSSCAKKTASQKSFASQSFSELFHHTAVAFSLLIFFEADI